MAFGKKQKTEDVNVSEMPEVKPEKPRKLTPEEKKAAKEAKKAEVKRVKEGRKELKKDLRLNGVRKRSEFEFFAEDLDLSYPEGTWQATMTKFAARVSRTYALVKASITLKSVLIFLLILLAATFLIAYITEEKGHFTINLTADMLRDGFQISEDKDFTKTATRLFADEIANSNATSIYEINRKVADIDGSHNGPGYMAYTFYLKNAGTETTDYGYTVNILSETLGTGKAAWFMFFEDGKQIIYARPLEDGTPERLWGYPNPPFQESAYYPEAQYYKEDGRWGIVTTPFVDEETALQGYVKDFKPGDVKKYTCVVWLEGDDPDCNNSILGGHVGFNVQFERIGPDEDTYFKGLFREEYDKYYSGDTEYRKEEGGRGIEEEAHIPSKDEEEEEQKNQ